MPHPRIVGSATFTVRLASIQSADVKASTVSHVATSMPLDKIDGEHPPQFPTIQFIGCRDKSPQPVR
jgi:hypothetical protein